MMPTKLVIARILLHEKRPLSNELLDVSCLATVSENFVICHRSCMLQADSEKLRQAWIKAVQTSIATAYREKGDESEVSLTIHQTTTSL